MEKKKLWMDIDRKGKQFQINQLHISPTVPLPVIQPCLLADATVDLSLFEKRKLETLLLLTNGTSIH